MNKKIKQKLIVALAITTVIALPLTAKPIRQKITAYLNPHITYTFDGQNILKGNQTVTYNNQNYVSVGDLAKALGKEVSFKDGVVSITTPEDDQSTSGLENGIIEKAIIKEVNVKGKTLTILPVGQADKLENYMIINVSNETQVVHERLKSIIRFEELEEGMTLKIIHAPMVTASLPAQTTAYKLVVLHENNEVVSSSTENGVIEKATIKEIDVKGKKLTVLPQGQVDKVENYIIINVPYQDKVFNERIKSVIRFEDLEVGMTLKIIHAPVMTASLPAQTIAYKIIVLHENNSMIPPVVDEDDKDDHHDKDDDDDEIDEIDDAKIIAIDHSQKTLTVKNEDGTFTVTFTNKTKVKFDDKKNKNPNANSLKVGQVVDIELEDGTAKSIEVD